MNKFYYIENNEVKEIETVKDLEFIKKNKHESAVSTLEEIPIPYGYVLNEMIIEKTPEKIKLDKILILQQELVAMDNYISRDNEDLYNAQVAKGLLEESDLNEYFIENLTKKRAKRAELLALINS